MELKTELLTLMVTPAVLISASGLMILATTNRYARVIDRIREIDRELVGLFASPAQSGRDNRIANFHRQLNTLRRRGLYLRDSVFCMTAAVAALVAASLSTVVAFTWLEYPIVLPLILVCAGMVALLAGSLLLLLDIRVSFRALDQDVGYTLSLQPPGSEPWDA